MRMRTDGRHRKGVFNHGSTRMHTDSLTAEKPERRTEGRLLGITSVGSRVISAGCGVSSLVFTYCSDGSCVVSAGYEKGKFALQSCFASYVISVSCNLGSSGFHLQAASFPRVAQKQGVFLFFAGRATRLRLEATARQGRGRARGGEGERMITDNNGS